MTCSTDRAFCGALGKLRRLHAGVLILIAAVHGLMEPAGKDSACRGTGLSRLFRNCRLTGSERLLSLRICKSQSGLRLSGLGMNEPSLLPLFCTCSLCGLIQSVSREPCCIVDIFPCSIHWLSRGIRRFPHRIGAGFCQSNLASSPAQRIVCAFTLLSKLCSRRVFSSGSLFRHVLAPCTSDNLVVMMRYSSRSVGK